MKKILAINCVSLAWLMLACQPDDNLFERPAPAIMPMNVPAVVLQEQGRPVMAEIELRSTSGLDRLDVLLNDEPYETVSFQDELLTIYEFNYTVEDELEDGTLLNFRFELTDKAGVQAEAYTLRIRVGPPFSITDETINGQEVKVVKGRINRDVTFEAQYAYLLDSLVSVEEGSTLTIEAGTSVYFKTYNNDIDSRLAITRGSRIIADGSKESPIVFTSDKLLLGEEPETADWGGLYIYGNAPTNQAATVLEEGFRYGGDRDNESSGSLRYLRIEYAGKNDADGIQLFGVGSGTQLEYLQIYRCFDNAVRFKGGSASMKHLVCTGFGAYGLWAEHGWRGRGQFWVFHTDVPVTIIPVNFNNQARSVELRNDPNNFELQPATYAYFSNITMIGNGNSEEDGTRRGIRVRRGAYGLVRNLIVTNFPNDAVRVEDVPQQELEEGVMLLADVRSFNNRTNYGEQAEDYFLPQERFNLSTEAVPGISPESFVGSVPSPFDPATDPDYDSWFDPAPFIGAVQNEANDWTADGVWCRDLNGNIR